MFETQPGEVMTHFNTKDNSCSNRGLFSLILWLLIILLIFEDAIQQVSPIFGYFDEAFALFGGVYYFFNRRPKAFLGIWWLLVLYVVFGLLGWCFNSSQPIQACLGDVFLNLKFFLALAFGLAVSSNLTSVQHEKMLTIIHALTYVFTILLLLNFVFNLFPGQEMRFGISIPKLFFSHSEYLAGAQIILLAAGLYLTKRNVAGTYVWVVFATLNVFCTFRYKAMAAAVVAVALFYVVLVRRKAITKWNLVVLCCIALLLAWGQITDYYLSGNETARNLLGAASAQIALDCFPIGTGFGSFASYMSKVFYSQVYFDYHLSGVYGLMNIPGGGSFISDVYWPMVLGQTGVVGLACIVAVYIKLFKMIQSGFLKDPNRYVCMLLLLLYLLIQSTASAAFVGPLSVPIGFLIGALAFDVRKVSSTKIAFRAAIK